MNKKGGHEVKKSVKFLITTVALTAGVLAFSKADCKAAVNNVKQTEAEDNLVKLQWDAELGAQSYAVQFSQDGNSWVTMEITSSTSETIDNLSAGSTYYARVGSFSEYSWNIDKDNISTPVSGWSAPVEVVTAPNTDNITLTQVDATTKSITMKCSEVEGANLYQLSAGIFDDFSVIGESEKNVITTSETIALAPGTSYSIYCYPCRVAASTGFIARDKYGYANSYGNKTVTNKVANNNFGFTNIWYNIDSYQIGVLSKDAVGDYDGVQVQLQTPSGKVKKTLTGSGSELSVNNINGTFYRYRLRTYVDCGTEGKAYSAWTGYRYFGVTKKLSVTSSKNKIKANWAKVANSYNYTVYISTNENSGFKKVKTVSNKSRSVTISKCGKNKIKHGKRYYLRIYTNAKVGNKTYKSEIISTSYITASKY